MEIEYIYPDPNDDRDLEKQLKQMQKENTLGCLIMGLFLLGGLTATAAEYLTALFYHYVLHVSFWDYRGLPGSLQGRVCLPFSLTWGLLSVVLVRWFHPLVSPWLAAIPAPVSWAALAVFLCDAVFSAVLLRRTGSKACLNWLTA